MDEMTYWEQMALVDEVEQEKGEIILYGPGFEYWTNDIYKVYESLKRQGKKPDILLCYLSSKCFLGPLGFDYVKSLHIRRRLNKPPVGLNKITDIPKVLRINDAWHVSPNGWDNIIFGHGFTDILATYSPPFLRQSDFIATYSDRVRENILFHPHPKSVNAKLYSGKELKRTIDVTMLGAMGDYYPLRDFMHKTLLHQRRIKYFNRPHPGYKYKPEKGVYGKDYVKILKQSKIFLCGTSKLNIPLGKLYEVLVSGAMLMCNKPMGYEHIGLQDGVNFVDIDKSNFMDKLSYYLKNDRERKRVADAGRKLFLAEHTTEIRAKQLYSKLESIIDSYRNSERGYRKALSQSYKTKLDLLIFEKKIIRIKKRILRKIKKSLSQIFFSHTGKN